MNETTYDFFSPFARRAAFADDLPSWASRYKAATPFPHIVLDGLFDPEVLRAVTAEIPSPHTEPDRLFRRHRLHLAERKFAFRDVPSLGPHSIALINLLNSKPFLEFLTALTGIGGLIPDPYLEGAGFHQIVRDGKLMIHADSNIHGLLQAYRRLNLLLYLNEGWDIAWRGELELWPEDMSAPAKLIPPLFNRLVIFTTTDTSYHGHPEPLACPPDVVRRSLALYYYTVERPSEPHSTMYRDRPQDAGVIARARNA